MDIEKELQIIADKKEGNKEMAFFYDPDEGEWIFALGNESVNVMLGEISGEIETSGHSLANVVYKMKKELGI